MTRMPMQYIYIGLVLLLKTISMISGYKSMKELEAICLQLLQISPFGGDTEVRFMLLLRMSNF